MAAATPDSRPSADRSYRGSPSQKVCLAEARAQPSPRAFDGVANRARVHYALTGPDALPAAARRDGDRNGVPDYVECVQAAASYALQRYERFGFRVPSAKLDVYVVKDVDGGNAIGMAKYDAAGAFVEIRSNLDPRNPGTHIGKYISQGLWVTLTHELFHVVQSRYVRTSVIPRWIREGSANHWSAILTGVSRDFLGDINTYLGESAEGPVSGDPEYDCVSCYGSGFFWTLFEFPEGVALNDLPERPATRRLLELFAGLPSGKKAIGEGWDLVERAHRAAYPSRKNQLFSSFIDMAYAVTGPHPSPREKHKWKATELPPVASSRAVSRSITLPPLAAARLPIPIPGGQLARVLEVTVTKPGAMNVFLAVGGKLGVRLDADARTTTWRVDASGTGHACRLQGAPINHDAQPWHGIDSSTGLEAEANAPTVNCMRGVVDLVAANDSASRKSTAKVTYRLLPGPVEVPGHDVRGDSEGGGPDIGRVTMVPTKRVIQWAIEIGGWNKATSIVGIWIDADENGSTGAPGPDAQGARLPPAIQRGHRKHAAVSLGWGVGAAAGMVRACVVHGWRGVPIRGGSRSTRDRRSAPAPIRGSCRSSRNKFGRRGTVGGMVDERDLAWSLDSLTMERGAPCRPSGVRRPQAPGRLAALRLVSRCTNLGADAANGDVRSGEYVPRLR